MSRSASIYHGIDFSGAKDSRCKTWVSTWEDGEPASTTNGWTHEQLVERIAGSAADGCRHYWLIDAPSGLPRVLLEEHGIDATWDDALRWLRGFDSPRAWRRACREVSRKEPRRRADVLFKTPMSPTNLRLFKQTWTGLVAVLEPLAEIPHVAVLPVAGSERAAAATVWVGEGCPSSTLRHLDW